MLGNMLIYAPAGSFMNIKILTWLIIKPGNRGKQLACVILYFSFYVDWGNKIKCDN